MSECAASSSVIVGPPAPPERQHPHRADGIAARILGRDGSPDARTCPRSARSSPRPPPAPPRSRPTAPPPPCPRPCRVSSSFLVRRQPSQSSSRGKPPSCAARRTSSATAAVAEPHRRAAGLADDPERHPGLQRHAPAAGRCPRPRPATQIPPLVLAEEPCRRRPSPARRRSRRRRPPASAISAAASASPPSPRSCAAATSPAALPARTNSPAARSAGEVDRRRVALLAPEELGEQRRLPEVPARLAESSSTSPARGAMPDQLVERGEQPDRADRRRRQDRPPVGLVVEADVARHDRHVERRCRPRRCRGCSRRAGP